MRNRATMPSLGKIEGFNSATTSINCYLEQLEQYFVANSVPADYTESHKRRAILISVIGTKAYDVLSDLCSPIPPSEETYMKLTTILSFPNISLPFGIASSPALFQRTMDIILQGLDHVASIQDDILTTGKDDDDHIKNLDSVFSCWTIMACDFS